MGFERSSIPSSQLVTSVGCITLLRCVGWREHPKAFGAFMMERGRGVFAATFDPRTDDASSSFAFPLSPFSQRIKNSQSLLFDASIER